MVSWLWRLKKKLYLNLLRCGGVFLHIWFIFYSYVVSIFLTPFKLYALWAEPLSVINLCVSLFVLKCFGRGGPQDREHIVEQTVFSNRYSFFLLHLIWDYKDRVRKKHIWSHTNQDFMYKRKMCCHMLRIPWAFFNTWLGLVFSSSLFERNCSYMLEISFFFLFKKTFILILASWLLTFFGIFPMEVVSQVCGVNWCYCML